MCKNIFITRLTFLSVQTDSKSKILISGSRESRSIKSFLQKKNKNKQDIQVIRTFFEQLN